MPNIHENPEILNFLHNYTDLGYGSYILFMIIGTVLTILIQSSSATMALTLVMCANGWIGYDIAASMVLEKTSEPRSRQPCAMVAKRQLKEPRFAHFLFNLWGHVGTGHIPVIFRLAARLSDLPGNRGSI
ncbi:MAG: hypothetical protein ACLTZT_16100 [Butyricimonas faecalis]